MLFAENKQTEHFLLQTLSENVKGLHTVYSSKGKWHFSKEQT